MSLERLPPPCRLLMKVPRHPIAAVDVAAAILTNTPRLRRVRIGNGMIMNILVPDTVSTFLRMGIPWEPEVTAFMKRVIKPGDIFFNIGAHLGYHSLMAASMVGESGWVVAFEPTPSTFKVLRENAVQCGNIILENLAVNDGLSDQVELRDFGIRYCGSNTVIQEARIPPRLKGKLSAVKVLPVPAISIDQYTSHHPELIPTVIKIDAEKAEMSILKGAAKTIQQYAPAIILECGLGRTPDISTMACLRFLGANDYIFYGYDFSQKQICNLLFQKITGDYCNILGVHTSETHFR